MTGGLSTIGKLVGAGGLLGYFTSKGIAPEEAKQLAQDVYRGKGAGLDMIKADIQKYKSGESSEADMFAKGYNFLPERSRIRQGSADGGRIGYDMGGLSTIERAKALFEERDEAAPTPSPEAGSIKNESNKERAFMKLLDTEAIDKRADDKMEMINRLIEMGMMKKKY